MKHRFCFFFLLLSAACLGQSATVKEYKKTFKTYPFSDPDPIARMGNIYPYFRFDGYADKGVDKPWTVVELENPFISVMILPEIGGKIWAATEKSTGKPFLYYNHVVKFRDIAMRGPWTSGGIEANYGIIGHTPNCSTPVDYLVRTNDDGSVSCFIGTLDLLTDTYWTIEVNLPKDKAYFTTRSFWSNTSSFEQPYYTWMNAGIKAAGNLEFVYPGTHYLGHDGSNKPWKLNPETGKDISFYEQNNVGPYKSYHVFGKYTNFFGGFWHDENFGMGRYAAHDEKAGKKIWIWGLSQQGMIWEKLLSDTDGQYVEVQSGRLFNQTDHTSTATPFKHRGFSPYSTDTWTEYWFPVKGTHGFVAATPVGAMNVRKQKSGNVLIDISPLQNITRKLKVSQGSKVLYEKEVTLRTMQLFTDSLKAPEGHIDVVLGDHELVYSTNPESDVLARPIESPKNFDWHSVQGLYIEGKEFIRERQYIKAEEKLTECLSKDPNFIPALTDLAVVNYRNLEYEKALSYLRHALSIDTYDPAANYYYGLVNTALGKHTDAQDGFDIAAMSAEYRTAAYTAMARLQLSRGMYTKAVHYSRLALDNNQGNVEALQLMTVALRLTGDSQGASETRSSLNRLNPLNHFASFEQYLLKPGDETRGAFTMAIRNELAVETYLELATWYYRIGLLKESESVLSLCTPNAEVMYWQAFLKYKSGLSPDDALASAIKVSVEGVFPFRPESVEVLTWAAKATSHWKPSYLLALIFWNKNQTSRAKELFTTCGDRPDFAPFYAARAELISQTTVKDLEKASTMDPGQWRYARMLIQHYFKEHKYAEALRVAQDFNRRRPNDFRMELLLAKAFLLLENYEASLKVLAKTNVLPYEGSTEGHALYREALLLQGIKQMKAGKYAAALDLIGKARLYPANLGVGKPYDADIDSRAEYLLEGMCHLGMKNQAKAKASWTAVVSQHHKPGTANDLISSWAMRKLGEEKKGEALLADWLQREPMRAQAIWCMETFQRRAVASPQEDDSQLRILQAIFQLNP
ncbi:MAG: DUF5107 domain-containing protein [Cyclobacteriaceae bacterium]|nr:DUF5107 domain-containing protein [Cyclobacteriaceae bacterium]